MADAISTRGLGVKIWSTKCYWDITKDGKYIGYTDKISENEHLGVKFLQTIGQTAAYV